METHFPGVVARFNNVAKIIGEKYQHHPQFGYFFCICFNIPLPDYSMRVLLRPHLDYKNPIAICAVYVYCKRGCELIFSTLCTRDANAAISTDEFKSNERVWLVIWELGVVVELPAGVFALFPSSLLYHFNVDIHGA